MTCTTIFLGTDGRHATLARGMGARLSDEQAASLRQQGVAGWVVHVTGSLHARADPVMERVATFGEVSEAAWTTSLRRLKGGFA